MLTFLTQYLSFVPVGGYTRLTMGFEKQDQYNTLSDTPICLGVYPVVPLYKGVFLRNYKYIITGTMTLKLQDLLCSIENMCFIW